MSEQSQWYWVLNDISAKNAGLNVRTKPVINELQKSFCAVLIVSTDQITKMVMENKVPEDVAGFVFAKPSQSSSALLMTYLRANGYPVVIDLFDNYFSYSKWSCQLGIPYLWMQSLYLADAVIVSTSVIKERISFLRPAVPLIHVCDPLLWIKSETKNLSFPAIRLQKWQGQPLKRKLLWFGIASNPWYQVGLTDLIKWLPLMKKLYARRPLNTEIELVICSNEAASMLNVVMQYQQAEIPIRFVAWSEQACANELQSAHCVLLPTGASEFSCSKTHNRLSEAINNRCIVLTTSISPYENFMGGVVHSNLQVIEKLLFETEAATLNSLFEQTESTLEKHHPFVEQIKNLAKQLTSKHQSVSLPAAYSFKFVIMANQANAIVAKIARKIRYLIVGYSSNQVGVTYDIYLHSVEPKSQMALISCSTLGKEVLETLKLQLTPSDQPNLFSLPLPAECIDLAEKLFLYYQFSNEHKNIYSEISKLSTMILISLLGKENSEIFLADDLGVCWPAYIKNYANYLAKPIQKLELTWKKTYEMQ
jgi:hypothetical protein